MRYQLWIGCNLTDLVEIQVRTNAETDDVDASVFDAISLDYSERLVVHSTVLKQKDCFDGIGPRIGRHQFQVGLKQSLRIHGVAVDVVDRIQGTNDSTGSLILEEIELKSGGIVKGDAGNMCQVGADVEVVDELADPGHQG